MAAAGKSDVEMTVPKLKNMDKEYPGRFLASVHGFWKRESLVDVILEVEGRPFACHRLVLAANSPYFACMFTGGFSETKQQRVSLKEVDADCVEEILNYVYSGSVQVSSTNARGLYLASDLLQVEHMRRTCLQFMVNQVNVDTCVESYQFARAYGITELLQSSKAFICRKFSQLSQTEAFMELPLTELKDILSSDDLDIQSELLVLQTVESWIQYNPEERMVHLEEAASVVRFNLIPPDQVPKLFSRLEVTEQDRETGLCKKGRIGMDAKELLVFFSISRPLSSLSILRLRRASAAYDRETNVIYQLSNPPSTNPLAMIVSEKEIVYLLYNTPDFNTQFVMFDAANNQWIKRVPPLNKHDTPCNLACVGNKVYLFGDATDPNINQNVECFDPTLNQWTAVTPFPDDLGDSFFTASAGQYIYVVSSTYGYLYRYNATTDCWYKLKKMTTKLVINDICWHAGKLYCVNESMRRMLSYNIETNSWCKEDILDLPEAKCSQLISYQGSLRAVLVPKHADGRMDRIQIHTLWIGEPEQYCDQFPHCLPPVCFERHRFICLSARLFPPRLNSGQHFFDDDDDDDDSYDDDDSEDDDDDEENSDDDDDDDNSLQSGNQETSESEVDNTDQY